MLNILLAIVVLVSTVITVSIFTFIIFEENKRKKEVIKQIRARGSIVRKIERN